MRTLWSDMRFALRMLLKRPAVAAVAVVTLALWIGANTAIFSVVHAVLLRPLPFADHDRVVLIFTQWRAGLGGLAVGNFEYILIPDGKDEIWFAGTTARARC